MHVPDLDDYDGPPSSPPRQCTCAGTAPGYPMHETGCGEPEPDEDELMVQEQAAISEAWAADEAAQMWDSAQDTDRG